MCSCRAGNRSSGRVVRIREQTLVSSVVENESRDFFQQFEQRSLCALLWAAAESRTGRRDLALYVVSIIESLGVDEVRRRARVAGPNDLDSILDVARAQYPVGAPLGDFEPRDPTLVVRWSAGHRRLRIDPGLFEDPVGFLAELERLSILDDEAVRAVGFRLSDLVEVALWSMDRELARLGSIWRRDDSDGEEELPRVSLREFDLARRRSPGGALADREVDRVVGSCTSPERARRALDFATIGRGDLATDLTRTIELWDGMIAIAIGGRRTFVPSSLILEGLHRAATKLAARLERRKRYRSRRGNLALAALGIAVHELDNDLIFPVDIGTERPVVVVRTDKRHLLAIDAISGATADRLSQEMDAARSSLNSIDVATSWTSPVGPLLVPVDAEIVKLVVVDAPQRVVIDTATQPVAVSLNDIEHVVGRVEDSVELWEFLAEVVDPPHIGRLIAPGLAELFDLWDEAGSLNPDYIDVTEAAIGWSTFLDFWGESAAWEPFDAVLAGAGRHSSAHARRRQIALPNEAHLWSRDPKHLTIVRTGPNLILDVPLDDLGPLDVQTVADFASMMSAAAEHLEPFGRAIETCGAGLAMVILANSPRPSTPELEKGDPWIGGTSTRSPSPLVVIRFDHHLPALFAVSPERARYLLASALAQAMRELGVSRRLAAECVDAWRGWRGAFRVVAIESAPPRPFFVARTTRAYDTARVRRNLSDRLRPQGLKTGSYADTEAIRLCDRHITSSLYSMLVDEIATYDRPQLLALGASEVGAAFGEQRRRSLEIQIGLAATWADDVRMQQSIGSQELVKWVRSVQLVLELSLRGEDVGERNVGRIDWARMLAIADSMFEISQMRSQARFLLERFEIDLDGDAQVTMRLGGPSVYAVTAFDVLRRLFELRPVEPDEASGSEKRPEGERLEEEGPAYEHLVRSTDDSEMRRDQRFESFIESPEVSEGLRIVDAAMRQHLGTGYDAILATLRTARSWPRDPEGEYAEVDLKHLSQDICDWSGLHHGEVLAAIDLLTLRPADLRSEAEGGIYPYWQVERRKFRCATRPLLDINAGKVWVIPELAAGAQRILARYLFDGRLPWPDLPRPLDRALRDYRRAQNLRLEQLAEERLNNAGFIARRGLKPPMLRRAGVSVPDSVGEIDVLVADTQRRRLWVIEAKDPEEPFTAYELWSGAEEFRQRYEAQLRRKAIGVVAATDQFIAFLGAEPSGGWAVNQLFLTSRVELAAFDDRIDAPFVVLDDVVEMLRSDTPPVNGLFVPKWARRLLSRVDAAWDEMVDLDDASGRQRVGRRMFR